VWPFVTSAPIVLSKIVKQGSDPELVNVKLLVVSDTRGTISVSLWTYVCVITAKVTVRGDAGSLQRDASSLHPQ
jgi:hypothetical protein